MARTTTAHLVEFSQSAPFTSDVTVRYTLTVLRDGAPEVTSTVTLTVPNADLVAHATARGADAWDEVDVAALVEATV